ncbi:hypothetical protein BTE56_13295 [Agrobacterium pusense]|nr:hypothetical protein BTE56_13295 [Agrobacterium pusense]
MLIGIYPLVGAIKVVDPRGTLTVAGCFGTCPKSMSERHRSTGSTRATRASIGWLDAPGCGERKVKTRAANGTAPLPH